MAVLIKLLILMFSFIIGLNNIEYNNAICSIVSLSLFLYFCYNLRKQYINYINDNWRYSDTTKYSVKTKFWDDSWFDTTNYNSKSYSYDYYPLNKNTIKILEKKIKKQKHNFIEYCDEPKFLKKDMIVNNSNPNKPKLDLNNVLSKKESNEKRNENLDGSDIIMVINDNKLDNVKKIVYDTIIKTLSKYKLTPNERYALFQSFYYIDVCPMSVVIYIDNYIIEKAHLNENSLHKCELIDKIRDSLYCPDMDVIFVDLNSVSLLNYFLNK